MIVLVTLSIILITLSVTESLVVVPISQASADQRAGRAGRVRSGLLLINRQKYFHESCEDKDFFCFAFQEKHTDYTQVFEQLDDIIDRASNSNGIYIYYISNCFDYCNSKSFLQRTISTTSLQQPFRKCKGAHFIL